MFTDKRILAIDDTASIRTFLRISLQAQGAHFIEASTAAQGLLMFHEKRPDLVVLDLGLPDRDGLEILPEIMQQVNGVGSPPVVILSVRKEQRIKDKAMELGAAAYITKPFMMEDLLEVLSEKLLDTKPEIT